MGCLWLGQVLLGASLLAGSVGAVEPPACPPPARGNILDDLGNPLVGHGTQRATVETNNITEPVQSPRSVAQGAFSLLPAGGEREEGIVPSSFPVHFLSPGDHPVFVFLPDQLTRLWQGSEETEPSLEATSAAEDPVLSGQDQAAHSSVLPPWLDKEWRHLCMRTHTCFEVICWDFQNMYGGENLAWLGVGLAVAAPLANTSADLRLSDWYRREVRSRGTDRAGQAFKPLGEHKYLIPVFSVTLLATCWAEEGTTCGWIGEWSRRTVRAWIIGSPAVGALQYGLGASRPSEGSTRWRPFQDNNSVAGHGFIAAVPFLTAASMCDNRCAKTALVAASALTSFSRFNNDAHSASQILLGWWIAYLAVDSVCRTEKERRFQFVPACQNADLGLSLVVQY